MATEEHAVWNTLYERQTEAVAEVGHVTRARVSTLSIFTGEASRIFIASIGILAL